MRNKLSIVLGFVLVTAMISCSKSSNAPAPPAFQAITFKFGPDTTSITIDQASMVIKNMPRSCDVTKLIATAVLPAGFSISPDPSAAKDYSKGVTYTVTNAHGQSYTMQITAPVYDATNNPYGIYTPKHLNDVRNGLNDSYVLMNDIDLPNLGAANASAITGISDFSTYGWFSIGTSYVNGGHVIFRGSLDGQNHVVKNFTMIYRGNNPPPGIDAGHVGKSFDGLFGYAVHATFKNIGIQLVATGINDVAIDGSTYGSVGALVGRVDSSNITNCYVTGNGFVTAGQNTGGLIGRANNTTITKCYSTLTPAGGTAIRSLSNGGGLIGGANQCDIADSYSTCSIGGAVDVGGLLGSLSTSTLKTSYASGSVTELPLDGSSSLVPFNSVGGLVGTVNSASPGTSTIQNSYATGAVSGANGANTDFHKGTRIGGLIGQIASNSAPVSVTFCYTSGTVSRAWTSSTAPYLTGGLVGTTFNNVFITSSSCTNYWDKEKTGQTYLGGGNGALATDNAYTVNGKTSAEMKSTATFLNWDFSTVWSASSTINNGYPYLRSINK